MKKFAILALGLLASLGLLAGPATAQDGPTVTTDPASVDAPGEYELTISGTGYTIPEAFVVPCAGAGGDVAKVLESAPTVCDFTSFTPVTPDADGNWEATITYEVPEGGLVIAAGDQALTEVGLAVVTIGGADDAPAELAYTGNGTTLALAGMALVAAGSVVVIGARRFEIS